MTGAARLWATTQWRRQWPTLLLAWIVLTLTGALALGAATGARRAVSAFDRLREQTFATDIQIQGFDLEAIGGGITTEDAVLRLLPLIDAAGATSEEQFFIFPHAMVGDYFAKKAAKHDRWLGAMEARGRGSGRGV